ncbi:hypothetical protein [Senegalia massiliensis]|nr:hypothetical protein [Senegalia massiliensis]
MNRRFMNGIIAGSILSAAGMYASARMNPRQRRKMMKNTRKMFMNMF